jgi:RNA polymerase sigma-70 factor (ECF subfamily)
VLQAAIAAEHARAMEPADTDWARIAALYGFLAHVQPTSVVELNRAVALAMAEGPERGLELLDDPGLADELDRYHLFHSARANLLLRAGRPQDAAAGYRRALELATNPVERSFMERKLEELSAAES